MAVHNKKRLPRLTVWFHKSKVTFTISNNRRHGIQKEILEVMHNRKGRFLNANYINCNLEQMWSLMLVIGNSDTVEELRDKLDRLNVPWHQWENEAEKPNFDTSETLRKFKVIPVDDTGEESVKRIAQLVITIDERCL